MSITFSHECQGEEFALLLKELGKSLKVYDQESDLMGFG